MRIGEAEPRRELPSHIVPVELRGGLVGHQITEPRKSLDISSMFNRGLLSEDEIEFDYASAYFRIKGGWVYHLFPEGEEDGVLVGPSRPAGKVTEERFLGMVLDTTALTVGQIFIFDIGGTKYTPVVTEIVGVIEKPTEEDSKVAQGRYNSIIEDFETQE